MACQTCTHTMHCVAPGVFWCPRCGSIKANTTFQDIPQLVIRCQKFGETLGPRWDELWHQLGIEEAIYPPVLREEKS